MILASKILFWSSIVFSIAFVIFIIKFIYETLHGYSIIKQKVVKNIDKIYVDNFLDNDQ